MSDAIRAALDAPASAPQLAQAGDTGPDMADQANERPPFPPGSPIKPLGISSDIGGSQKCYYLNYNGQLTGLEAGNRHGKNSLIALFGPRSDWLEANYPQWSAPTYEGRGKDRQLVKPSEIVGFDQAEASRAMIEECARRGIFDPAGRMRGRGAHRIGVQGLVLHFGDKLLASQHRLDGGIKGWGYHDAGLHENFVYPAAAPLARPWHESVGEGSAERLLHLLMQWHFKRPLLDPRFLLGWIGAAMVGGALDWRPNVWLTGGRGTGKTSLNGRDQVLHQIFGEGLFRTGDASAAAIRQTLRNSTVPVVFDEIEASDDNRRVQEVINLARVSSSGDTVVRGGQDHQATEFTLASCFMFSSINIPPLQPQDRSRLGILELLPFKPGSVAPVLAEYNLPELGRKLQRRMIDGWQRLPETRARFMAAMSLSGHDARACTQFGTLLACADVLLNDELPEQEEIDHWVAMCRPDRMGEISEATPEETACLHHILTSMVQARGGDEREALGSWIGKAVANRVSPGLTDDIASTEKYDERLQNIGLKLVNARYHPEEMGSDGKVAKSARWGAEQFVSGLPGYLAVAGGHQGLSALFQGTKWQGGVWRQSLSRTDGAHDGVKVKFGRLSLRAVLVPLHAVLDDSEIPAASKPAAMAEWVAAQLKGAEA